MTEVVAIAPDPRRADDWTLVLTSIGIASRVEVAPDGAGLAISTREEDAARARDAIAQYEAEDRERRALAAIPPPVVPEWGTSWLGVFSAWAILAFFGVVGPATRGDPWFENGAAMSARMKAGELWRAVTALSLHADIAHAAGNAGASLILMTMVAWRVGPGLGAALAIAGGVLGNLAAAWAHGAGHNAVGASTATFAALGLLTGFEMVEGRARRHRRRRAVGVIAASMALLGFLGTSEGSDLAAHLFGWAAGVLLGLPIAAVAMRPPRTLMQALLAAATAALLACSWWIALR